MKLLLQGNVWFAIGLLCFSIDLVLDRYAANSGFDLVRGLTTGLSIAAFIVAIAITANEASKKKE